MKSNRYEMSFDSAVWFEGYFTGKSGAVAAEIHRALFGVLTTLSMANPTWKGTVTIFITDKAVKLFDEAVTVTMDRRARIGA